MGALTLLTVTVLYTSCVLQSASTWTVNNFLMTGPKAFLTYAGSVQVGAQSGIQECKHQFAWDRWNCPQTIAMKKCAEKFERLRLPRGSYLFEINKIVHGDNHKYDTTCAKYSHHKRLQATKETSFVHAISAAGVMHTLTKNCSMGDFDNCGCDDSRIGQTGGRGWIWGGCSDNVAFGEKISKQFVDALEDGHDFRAAVNLHNNEAGRLAIKATMRRACKCHGVSGSCSIQTCWMQLADFREVGAYLKNKHSQAKKLEVDKRPLKAGNSADNRGAITHAFRNIPRTELIFFEDSPDYCVRNRSLGYEGTEGRECLKGDKSMRRWERKSCRRLCYECGLRVAEKRTEVVSSCNCKFHWCCTVKCDRCTHVVTKYYCAPKESARKTHNKAKRKHRQRGR